jgi:hypothetical protein
MRSRRVATAEVFAVVQEPFVHSQASRRDATHHNPGMPFRGLKRHGYHHWHRYAMREYLVEHFE